LNNTDSSTRKKIIYILKNQNTKKEKVQWVIEQVEKTGGIKYATAKMNEYRNEALKILHSLPENSIRQGLEDMVVFVTDRKY
jgi:octaprenyl-diphosphate synthase